MSRLFSFAVLAMALVVSWAAWAEAQLPRGLRIPASVQDVFLLRGEAVQKELGVNDEQKALLADLAARMQQDAFEIISGLQDLTPEEQKEVMPEVIKMVAEKGKEVKDQVDGVLEEAQRERLKELSLQARGATALEDKEVAEALQVTDEQQKELAEIHEEGVQAIQQAFEKLRGGGGDQGEIRKAMMELRNELSEKALAVLTPEQRKQFEAMQGEKFEFPRGRGFPF